MKILLPEAPDSSASTFQNIEDLASQLEQIRCERDFAVAELGRARFQARRIALAAQPFLALIRQGGSLRECSELFNVGVSHHRVRTGWKKLAFHIHSIA